MQETHDNDEISIKELILKTQEYIKIIWSKKIPLIAVSLLFGLGFAVKSYLKPTTYTAELTFMVNQDEGGGMSGIGAMLGQFGLGGGGGASNFEKITEIARSGKICERTLMDSATVGGTTDLLANHIIKAYEMHDNSIGRSAEELIRKVQAAQYVNEHEGLVCPASWKPGNDTLKPGVDLIGKL